MEMFVDIFKQLGANQSLIHQFAIIVIVFYLSKSVFIKHLQQILENREDRTVNLEGNAEKQFEDRKTGSQHRVLRGRWLQFGVK